MGGLVDDDLVVGLLADGDLVEHALAARVVEAGVAFRLLSPIRVTRAARRPANRGRSARAARPGRSSSVHRRARPRGRPRARSELRASAPGHRSRPAASRPRGHPAECPRRRRTSGIVDRAIRGQDRPAFGVDAGRDVAAAGRTSKPSGTRRHRRLIVAVGEGVEADVGAPDADRAGRAGPAVGQVVRDVDGGRPAERRRPGRMSKRTSSKPFRSRMVVGRRSPPRVTRRAWPRRAPPSATPTTRPSSGRR